LAASLLIFNNPNGILKNHRHFAAWLFVRLVEKAASVGKGADAVQQDDLLESRHGISVSPLNRGWMEGQMVCP
jgi:hypothetical protein